MYLSMSKQKLWTSLRRVFSSSSYSPLNPVSKTRYFPYLSPYCSPNLENCSYFLSHRFDFLGDYRFSFKCFLCSKTAQKFELNCWNCNSATSTLPCLVCPSCRCVQPVDQSVDYFQIFGVEKRYDIEDENLERKYKDWQKQVHPDLVHSKSEKERDYAAEQSGQVTNAYRTLTNPLTRAIYILKLEGVNVDEEETISEPELLAEIMEIREAVEEAADSQTLRQIQSQMQKKLKHWSKTFAHALRSQNYSEAVQSIRRMKYYQRVNEEIIKRL